MGKVYPELQTAKIIKKYDGNPILTATDVPYDVSLVFNAGVVKYKGKYVMIFRNDYGSSEADYLEKGLPGTNLGLAYSNDGIHWEVEKQPFLSQETVKTEEVSRFYDPRLTVIDGELYICFAVDTRHGIRGGIGKIHDLKEIEVLCMTAPDNRNMVLFPEKIGGLFTRLERPSPVYGRGGKDRFDIWCSQSPDLKFWGKETLVLGVEDVPFANDKIGPAAPPIKTQKGWLTTFHAVDRDNTRGKNGWENKWTKRYTAGIMLLDLENPSKIIGISRDPLIAPELPYETDKGFRQNVIFPGGMILEENGEVKIYYGAADTVECLATAYIDDLLNLCL
ncbi:glycoside hydrolase family 130 protein [Ructibacterium gallinarum]|nr:glycoside hydrolase family 130 protein [Ructibacterium gallinarum]